MYQKTMASYVIHTNHRFPWCIMIRIIVTLLALGKIGTITLDIPDVYILSQDILILVGHSKQLIVSYFQECPILSKLVLTFCYLQ